MPKTKQTPTAIDLYSQAIEVAVMRQIERLAWSCKGCHYVPECEADRDSDFSRFCEPLIQAALLGQQSFKQPEQPRSANNNSHANREAVIVKLVEALGSMISMYHGVFGCVNSHIDSKGQAIQCYVCTTVEEAEAALAAAKELT